MDMVDLMGGLIGLLFLALVFALFCMLFFVAEYDPNSAVLESKPYKVVGLSYIPSRTTTGVGPSFGSNGGVAVTMSTSEEEYIVILKGNGETLRIDSEELFNNLEADEKEVVVNTYTAWVRLRLTNFKFGYENRKCEVVTKAGRVDILTSIED